MTTRLVVESLVMLLFALCAAASSDAQLPNLYGAPISLEDAKKVVAPVIAEARKNNWTLAVAVVDPGGHLIYLEKMDGTQTGSVDFAVAKARSATMFKRPTKVFEDALKSGAQGLPVLKVDGAVPVEGGIPLIMDGKIVGAVGASGATSAQDGQCAQAGASAVK